MDVRASAENYDEGLKVIGKKSSIVKVKKEATKYLSLENWTEK